MKKFNYCIRLATDFSTFVKDTKEKEIIFAHIKKEVKELSETVDIKTRQDGENRMSPNEKLS